METYNSEDRADRELQEKLNYIRRTWEMVLPVIACSGQSVENCEEIRGAVGVDVAWITQLGTDPQYNEVPRALFGQNCERLWPDADVMADATQPERIAMWDSFRRDSDLNLRNVTTEEGQTPYAPYDNFSLYFLPSCERFDPRGGSGGENFGILAKIPVLVCPDPTSQDAYGEDANNCLGGTGGT
jgi:hypothetical protein